ncbi:MAG TPA: YchJ family metal-binding protein [Ramlibacter sp.]|jgi:SEC-C motif-containing protein|uniref:YchJ family protein n=1 Tax=Ramlibacter sp. TaxID=1917967 RepID=UPI002D7499C7|nr:YchJ family metal-binding protein [Ramlibacter sp.]HZY20626.1 YchJ family metal-binding protein [Ramlibacter sp.]
MTSSDPCPCGRTDPRGRPLPYQACCGRYLAGQAAPDAESLMRSRYTAYVRNDEAYLLATWHPDTRPADVRPEPGTRWLGLEVKDHRQPDPDHAEVAFVARYRVQGRGGRLQERSRFVRADGRWFYRDGDIG